ncbi:MAG TPA: SRPBCC domain-containing protein [Kofleriaceae bacterium]|jgi:uncharacterized protein YndB with AHSA1/START domain/uncharacterized protein YciI
MSIGKGGASAVVDPEANMVLARVEIAKPIERVFAAITSDEMSKWWGSPELYQTKKFTADLRPGGAWKSEGVGADGHAFHVAGEVIAYEPPTKYVHTWKPSWEPGEATTVAWLLETIDGGTRVTVRHTAFASAKACSDHANGWVQVLGWLDGYASPQTDKYFMIRLVNERPDFMSSMSASELAVMREHSLYLRSLIAQGKVIVAGPVRDAEGPYGMAVMKAADEAAIKAIEAADPAITRNIGNRYVIAPMLAAIH